MPYDIFRAGRKRRARKRHAPEEFPYPVWSDEDVSAWRKHAAEHRSDKTGKWIPVDRRKTWQKALRSCSVSKCGSIVTMR